MEPDYVSILKEIGKRFGKRVSSQHLFDPNVCTSPRDPECSWKWLELPGDIFRHKLSILFDGHKVRLSANGYFIAANVVEDLDIDVCSVGRRDRICLSAPKSLRIPGFPSSSFFSDSPQPKLLSSTNLDALQVALGTLQLANQESLHFYGNGIVFYLCRESAQDVIKAIAIVCRLAERLPKTREIRDPIALPPKFEKLSTLIPRWALSDDEERSEKLGRASLKALRSFVVAAAPFVPAINEYLDSFGGEPLSDAAIALGNLAECCTEAEILLRERQA